MEETMSVLCAGNRCPQQKLPSKPDPSSVPSVSPVDTSTSVQLKVGQKAFNKIKLHLCQPPARDRKRTMSPVLEISDLWHHVLGSSLKGLVLKHWQFQKLRK
jgi:hypothetical protein